MGDFFQFELIMPAAAVGCEKFMLPDRAELRTEGVRLLRIAIHRNELPGLVFRYPPISEDLFAKAIVFNLGTLAKSFVRFLRPLTADELPCYMMVRVYYDFKKI